MFFHPMSFGEILDGIFRSIRNTFWPLWWFLFLFNIPFELFFIFWEYLSDNESNVGLIPFTIFLLIYLFLLAPIFQNVCTNVVLVQMRGEEHKLSLQFLFALSFNRFGRLFLANGLILFLIIVLGLFIIFPIGLPIYLLSTSTNVMDQMVTILIISGMIWIFPASYIWIRFSLALPTLIIETESIKKAFARSWSLTKQSSLSLISKWVLLLGFQIPIYFLGVYLTEIFQNARFFCDFILLLIDPIFIAMPHVLLSLIYINQRAKKEAYDLQLMLEKRGETP